MPAKVVLVTGAARRIGAEIVRTFHRSGFNVVIHYHRSREAATDLAARLNDSRPHSASLWQLDLAGFHEWESLEDECLNHWGRLDVLVNNASTFYPTPVGSVVEGQWDDLIGTNLKAPFFLSQAVAPCLREVAGCIINLCDIHGDKPLHHYPVYSLAKAGLAMMTKSLARDLAPEVRVNGIAPGPILWPEEDAEVSASTKAAIIRKVPLKRQGAPEDVANTALFLACHAPYINGQILSVDGGTNLC